MPVATCRLFVYFRKKACTVSWPKYDIFAKRIIYGITTNLGENFCLAVMENSVGGQDPTLY